MLAKAVALTGSDQGITLNTRARYKGFAIRETGGATAVVRIYDNTAASGTLIDTISLTSGESRSEFLHGEGIALQTTGLYVDIVSGSVEGSIRVSV